MQDADDGLLIRVRSIDGRDLPIRVDESMSVRELKERVRVSTAVEEERQRLIYRGRVLQDAAALVDYSIENNHTIHMVARPHASQAPGRAAHIPGAAAAAPAPADAPADVPGDTPAAAAGLAGAGSAGPGRAGASDAAGGSGRRVVLGSASSIFDDVLNGGGLQPRLLRRPDLLREEAAREAAGRPLLGSLESSPLLGRGLGANALLSTLAAGGLGSLRQPANGQAAPRADSRSLEHVRQALLNTRSVLSTMELPRSLRDYQDEVLLRAEEREEEKAEKTVGDGDGDAGGAAASTPARDALGEAGPRSPAEALDAWTGGQGPRFFLGQWLDVKDTVNQWLEATVMDIRNDSLFVHYNGWPARWDEWIDASSPRIAPFRTRTMHSANAPHMSPTPNSRVANAPSADGEDDVRSVLPQVLEMLDAILPAARALAALYEEDKEDTDGAALTGAGGAEEDAPPGAPSAPGPGPGPGSGSGSATGSGSSPPMAAGSPDEDRASLPRRRRRVHMNALARQLAPLVDRVGRAFADLGPHVLSEVKDEDGDDEEEEKRPEAAENEDTAAAAAAAAAIDDAAIDGAAEFEAESDADSAAELAAEAISNDGDADESELSSLDGGLGNAGAPQRAELPGIHGNQHSGDAGRERAASPSSIVRTFHRLRRSPWSASPAADSTHGTAASREGEPQAFERLISTPQRTGPLGLLGSGNIDIHIHAILPLRGSEQLPRQPGGVAQAQPAQPEGSLPPDPHGQPRDEQQMQLGPVREQQSGTLHAPRRLADFESLTLAARATAGINAGAPDAAAVAVNSGGLQPTTAPLGGDDQARGGRASPGALAGASDLPRGAAPAAASPAATTSQGDAPPDTPGADARDGGANSSPGPSVLQAPRRRASRIGARLANIFRRSHSMQ